MSAVRSQSQQPDDLAGEFGCSGCDQTRTWRRLLELDRPRMSPIVEEPDTDGGSTGASCAGSLGALIPWGPRIQRRLRNINARAETGRREAGVPRGVAKLAACCPPTATTSGARGSPTPTAATVAFWRWAGITRSGEGSGRARRDAQGRTSSLTCRRMPCSSTRAVRRRLDPAMTDPDVVRARSCRCPDGMDAYPVFRAVGNVRSSGPQVVERVLVTRPSSRVSGSVLIRPSGGRPRPTSTATDAVATWCSPRCSGGRMRPTSTRLPPRRCDDRRPESERATVRWPGPSGGGPGNTDRVGWRPRQRPCGALVVAVAAPAPASPAERDATESTGVVASPSAAPPGRPERSRLFELRQPSTRDPHAGRGGSETPACLSAGGCSTDIARSTRRSRRRSRLSGRRTAGQRRRGAGACRG